tara:strand:+ start:240 stop:992 length:753 start_codon:yes stop_codon:yes gene_type:complete
MNIFSNKGAIFDLDCRVLKKQFGELFLTNRQSEAPQGASGSCGYTKRGAMFGLDARIALAIFGALSVISSAALYSAIKDAKTTAAYQSIIEILKASEAYYLDTGSPLNNMSGHPFDLNTNALIENEQSAQNWGGPYIQATKIDSISSKVKLNGMDISVYMYRNAADDWSTTASTPPVRCSAATKGCYEWLMTYTVNIDQANMISKLFTDLDNKYDNGDGSATGNIRYRVYSATNKRILVKGLLRGKKDEV